jgi:hypothetical protein
MPLTKKDKKIMSSMAQTYGSKEKAERVFYASANAGKLGADVKKRHGSAARSKKD